MPGAGAAQASVRGAKNMRLLIIGSDKILAGILKIALKVDGFQVEICHSSEEGIQLARREDYDAVILDTTRDGSEGTAAIRTIRKASIAAPLIVLCAGTSISTRVEALNLGADDCLVRPIHKA